LLLSGFSVGLIHWPAYEIIVQPMAGPESEKKLITDSGQLLKQCEVLEGELAALKARYEQYFLGIDRKPPSTVHRQLRQKIDGLKPAMARTTVVKLKIQNLHQKLQTYERLWSRTCQEMENGTYHRDLFKARLHARQREEQAGQSEPAPAGLEKSADPLDVNNLRSIYNSLLAAKRQCGEDVSRVTFDSVVSALRNQVPAVLKKHNATSVEFKVAVSEGKAVLKAIPKKD